MDGADRMLKYMRGTASMGITYGGEGASTTLVGYCDSTWGDDRDTGRSMTGYTFTFGGAAVSWRSKLQTTVAASSTEAEYIAVFEAGQEAVFLRQLLSDLGFPQEEATIIYEDNQGCISWSQGNTQHQRSKHMNIKYHFVRELVAEGKIKLIYIPTEHQLADMLTKPMAGPRLAKLRSLLMGHNNNHGSKERTINNRTNRAHGGRMEG